MNANQPRFFAALALAAVTSLGACVDSDTETGTVGIELVGQASSGATYRLRDAVITVEGPAPTLVWNTEDDPDRTSMSANVEVGSYTATLASGWRLERLVAGDPPVTVVATLDSPNPLAFEVLPMMRTTVPLRFVVEGDVVDMSQGYDIVLDIDDSATVGTIVTTATNLTVNEGGSVTFGVSLTNQPAGDVTVQIMAGAPSELAVTPNVLVFTPANYAVPQVVTLAALQDADVTDELITLSLSGGVLPLANVTVAIADDDVQAILTTASNLTVAEGGTAIFGLRLAAEPAAAVTVQILSSDTGAVVVSPAVLSFHPINFSTLQTVTVTGIQDVDLDNEAVTLSLTGPGIAPTSVAVIVTDNDTP